MLANVTVGYVRQVESGSENLTIASLVNLANLLEAELEELFKPPTLGPARRGRPKRQPPR